MLSQPQAQRLERILTDIIREHMDETNKFKSIAAYHWDKADPSDLSSIRSYHAFCRTMRLYRKLRADARDLEDLQRLVRSAARGNQITPLHK